jgi:hypothetical protein
MPRLKYRKIGEWRGYNVMRNVKTGTTYKRKKPKRRKR